MRISPNRGATLSRAVSCLIALLLGAIPLGTIAAGIFALGTSARGLGAEPEPEPIWELAPYRIQWLVAVNPRTGLPPDTAQALSRDLRIRTAAIMAGIWRLDVEPAPPALRIDHLASLSAVPASELATAYADHDKVALLLVDGGPAGLQVAVREFDVLLRQWNSTIVADVPQPAALQRELIRAAGAAFAPQARIDRVDDSGALSLRLRAGGIARRSAGVPSTSAGSLFRPVMLARQSNGQLSADGGELLPWTYLIVDKLEGTIATCHMQTALAAPVIPAYHPSRERLALGVTAGQQPTQLRLQATGDSSRSLADLDVSFAQADGGSSFVGRTDRKGSLSLPAGEPGLRWLEIRHGDTLLQRRPFVSGLEERMVLDLPDDSAGEKLAEELTSFSDRLVDLVARRELLVGAIRASLESRDVAAANALLKKLRDLPAADKLMEELERLQGRPETRAAAGQPTIAAEFAALQTLIKQHVGGAVAKIEKEVAAANRNQQPAADAGALPPSVPATP